MSHLGISDTTEQEARRLCLAAGVNPDASEMVGYWSYVIGGRAWMPQDGAEWNWKDAKSEPPHQAPKQWVEAEGPPAWTRYYALAKSLVQSAA